MCIRDSCVAGLCGGCCRRKGRGDAAYACGAHPKRLTYAEKCARADAPPPPPPAVVEKAIVQTRARALLLGMGADELLAGYARHRTAFKRGGLEELEREYSGRARALAELRHLDITGCHRLTTRGRQRLRPADAAHSTLRVVGLDEEEDLVDEIGLETPLEHMRMRNV